MKRPLLLTILLMSNYLANAQGMDNMLHEAILTPQFFITVISGVLLAFGFQFVLTALSVAAGITAIGDVKKSYLQSKNLGSEAYSFGEQEEDSHHMDSSGSTGVKVTSSFGIWSTLTVAISLFAATALAINLSLIAGTMIAITLALVIWSTFFILLFYLEGRVVNTLIGGLLNTATAGLRSSAQTVKNMFSSGPEQKIEKVADHTIEKVRNEFENPFDSNTLDEAIDEFFEKFDKKLPEYNRVKKDIESLVNESVEKSKKEQSSSSREQSSSGSNSSAKWMAVQSVLNEVTSKSSGDTAEDDNKTEQLKQLKNELQDAYQEGDSRQEQAKKAVAKLSSMEEKEVEENFQKVKDFLAEKESSTMSSEELEAKIKGILADSKLEAHKLGSRMDEMDRDTLIKAVSKNTSLSRMEAEKYADKAEKIIRRLQLELSGNNEDSSIAQLKEELRSYLQKFMDGDNSSEIDFSALSNILEKKMNNRRDDLNTIKTRLENVDKEQIINLVTNNSRIDRKDIDKVVDKVEGARTKVLDDLRKIEDTARGRLKKLERKAVIQAEHTRQTAAAAAWWLVISAIISAFAAIGGSLLTLF